MWVGDQRHNPDTLHSGKRCGTRYTGGLMGPTFRLDGCR
jgi:hypothetical protein